MRWRKIILNLSLITKNNVSLNSIDYVQNRVRKSSKVLVLVLSVDTCRVYREREREREREGSTLKRCVSWFYS
jgi:hypothetical protein